MANHEAGMSCGLTLKLRVASCIGKYNPDELHGLDSKKYRQRQSNLGGLLMRINKLHTILFTATAIMLLYLLENRFPPYYKSLSIHAKSSYNDVSKMLSMKGYKVYEGKDKYFERGGAKFSLIRIEGASTICGCVDILFSFFNSELASIKYVGFLNENSDRKKMHERDY